MVSDSTVFKTTSSCTEIHISWGLDKVLGDPGCAVTIDPSALRLCQHGSYDGLISLWLPGFRWLTDVTKPGIWSQDFWTPAVNSWHFNENLNMYFIWSFLCPKFPLSHTYIPRLEISIIVVANLIVTKPPEVDGKKTQHIHDAYNLLYYFLICNFIINILRGKKQNKTFCTSFLKEFVALWSLTFISQKVTYIFQALITSSDTKSCTNRSTDFSQTPKFLTAPTINKTAH